MTDWTERTTKLTNAEFTALDRYDNGDIADDLAFACIFMTPAQRERLTGDDQSRVDFHDEDMRCMIAAEFG